MIFFIYINKFNVLLKNKNDLFRDNGIAVNLVRLHERLYLLQTIC